MDFYTLNKEKCIHCSQCVQVCPATCFEMNEKKYPQLIKAMDKYCIACGHCVAVCPKGALSLANNKIEKQIILNKESINNNLFKTQMISTRSIRCYQDKEIPNKTIKELLDISRYAPTAVNQQKVNYIVFNGRKKVKEVSELVAHWMGEMIKKRAPGSNWFMGFLRNYKRGKDKILWDAPALILAADDQKNTKASESDAHIGITYLSLYANNLGLGSCWAGYVQWCARVWPELKKHFKIDENLIIKSALMLGYPKYKYQAIPQREDAKIHWID